MTPLSYDDSLALRRVLLRMASLLGNGNYEDVEAFRERLERDMAPILARGVVQPVQLSEAA